MLGSACLSLIARSRGLSSLPRALASSALSQPQPRRSPVAPLHLPSLPFYCAAHRRAPAAAFQTSHAPPPLAAHKGLRSFFASPAIAQRSWGKDKEEEEVEHRLAEEEEEDTQNEVEPLDFAGVKVVGAPRRTGKNWCAQLHVRAFDPRALQYACEFILHLADIRGVRTGNIIPLPSHGRLLTLNRSPHVHKKARDQFEFRTYKRLICIYDTAEIHVNQFVKELADRNPISVQIRCRTQYHIAPPAPRP